MSTSKTVRRAVKKTVDKVLPFVSLPRRIEGGAWWLATNDWVGDAIFEGTFEQPQRHFVERYLGPGMIVLDIGAHHGLYSLIAATRVGITGRVVSFEPSPRERERLERHKRINKLDQITIEPIALGSAAGTATLYLPAAKNSGFNSLHPSEEIRSEATPVEVPVMTLDDYVANSKLDRIDFIKLDVEGGELEVLKGGEAIFRGKSRPVILAEVEDERTQPWGYQAELIVRLLEAHGYTWYSPRGGGAVEHFDTGRNDFSHNLVAIPPERREQMAHLMVTV